MDPSGEGREDLASLTLEMVIGEDAGGSAEYQFSEIISLLRTPDGILWVLDGNGSVAGGQTPLLRQYDSTGGFLRQVGRHGSGPGEYRAPQGLALMSEGRVALRDSRLPDRITIYGSDGTVSSTWHLPGGRHWTFRAPNPIQVDIRGVMWLPFLTGPQRSLDRGRAFLRIRPDGTLLDTLSFPSTPAVNRERIVVERRDPSGGISIRGFSVPYQPIGIWAWSPEGAFATARTDLYRIDVHHPPPWPEEATSGEPSGGLGPNRIIERDVPRVQVPEGERATLRTQLVERLSSTEGGRGIDIPEMPTQKPPIGYVRFSEDGQILVRVSMPSLLEDDEWVERQAIDFFDPSGDFKGRAILPESFSIRCMVGDQLWGVFRGPLGVESIRRYRITWP